MKVNRIVLILMLSSIAVFAQTGGNPQRSKSEPQDDVVRITTSIVQTDVVVTDKNDQIISDLKLEDFKVFENGKKQDLQFIEFVGVGNEPRAEGSLTVASQPVEPEISRNVTSKDLRRVFAFVIDEDPVVPVLSFLMFTVAPATAAPFESVTVPLKLPVVAWAIAATAERIRTDTIASICLPKKGR